MDSARIWTAARLVVLAILTSMIVRTALLVSKQGPALHPRRRLFASRADTEQQQQQSLLDEQLHDDDDHRAFNALLEAQQGDFARRLAHAISFRTVSYDEEDQKPVDLAEFDRLHAFLETTYPLVHSHLTREIVNKSLLYTWYGADDDDNVRKESDSGAAAAGGIVGPRKAVLLTSHLDVVPVNDLSSWSHDPFGGVIADGFVFGRGSMDDKVGVLSILEATELLLKNGFRPKRTFVYAFGHDEEVGGHYGAGRMAKILAERGYEFELLVDEGLTIITDFIPTFERKVAMIGVAEKGFLNLKLTVRLPSGHSSTPPSTTAIGKLSRALARLEDNPFPLKITGPARSMLEYFAPEGNLLVRFFLANLDFFAPIIAYALSFDRTGSALFKTTQAITVFHSGMKTNVLPNEAEALINFRVFSLDKVSDVVERVRSVINDKDITIQVVDSVLTEPSPITDHTAAPFRLLEGTIKSVFGEDTVIVPAVLVANTDTKCYWNLTKHIFRFNPMLLRKRDVSRIHGHDERIGVENLRDIVGFFVQLIRNADEQYLEI